MTPVAVRGACGATFCALAVAFLAAVATAQSAGPTDSMDSWPVAPADRLWLSVIGHNRNPLVEVLPLTDPATDAVKDAENGYFGRAHAFLASPGNVHTASTDDFAFIDCEESAVNDMLRSAAVHNVMAIVLYSRQSAFCDYTGHTISSLSIDHTPIFSTVTAANATAVVRLLSHTPDSQDTRVAVVTQDYLRSSNNDVSGSARGTGDADDDPDSPLGPSPSTAVAMIILYSITGIITGLFLVIIVTGALRAHRHPERYGPRDGLGRPVQSRARGIARAMLDTIPIVKFGEREASKPEPGTAPGAGAEADVELGTRDGGDGAAVRDQNDVAGAVDGAGAPRGGSADAGAVTATGASGGSGDGEADTPPATAATDTTTAAAAPTTESHDEPDASLGCSICTDDFERGQDIRVLPCDHKFHPACIDPWLLNVSGTCPLCRTELRDNRRPSAQSDTLREPLPATSAPLNASDPADRASRRISAAVLDLLHLRRVRDAPAEERIAALRRYRQSSEGRRGGGGVVVASAAMTGEAENDADPGRRRLTARLNETFRVRTRRRGVDA